ncbi:sulfotransferase [Donghicola mangrovi]|uniref:Sulfotransferase n=1 Tax=Donghicola mangrovi TaxID=2729614 RepID=A0A850Q3S3_9RHOB|nr:sulfotransferase [Donghicola mangrovi]
MTPIFVLGLQRSGTTWMANQLAALDSVAAVEAPEHRGVHESIYFSHFARAFGPWKRLESRVKFAQAFILSDYGQLLGLTPELLAADMRVAKGYADLFRIVMDRHARNAGAEAWVEKSPHHTLMYRHLSRDFPDAKFVLVHRRTEGMILSRLSGFGRTPTTGLKRYADITRAAVVNTLFGRYLKRLSRKPNCFYLSYEELHADDGELRTALLGFLGVRGSAEAMESLYQPNTSFDRAPRRPLGKMDRTVMVTAEVIAYAMPLSLLLAAHRLRGALRGIDWPDWCWQKTGYHPDTYGRGAAADQ